MNRLLVVRINLVATAAFTRSCRLPVRIGSRTYKTGSNESDFSALHRPSIASPENHTMGSSLNEYLRIKVHPDILSRSWDPILINGLHDRLHASISTIEKTDKPFNWQRPTASTSPYAPNTIRLHVFPGFDYVQHYAAIVATYLSLECNSRDVVQYSLPTTDQCMLPLLQSNLAQLGKVDVVVMGYVHGLAGYTGNRGWDGGDSSQLFAWQKIIMPNGTTVAFLGCRVSFWGDIAGNVVRALQQLNGVRCVLYIGKLGSLRAEHTPNTLLASGNRSSVKGETVEWDNALAPFLASKHEQGVVVNGMHLTLPSVLDETKEWLAKNISAHDFVDPEIGHMAKASLEGGTEFGYLHIISDNVARKYAHDLSNERLQGVLIGRKGSISEIQEVLRDFFEGWRAKGV